MWEQELRRLRSAKAKFEKRWKDKLAIRVKQINFLRDSIAKAIENKDGLALIKYQHEYKIERFRFASDNRYYLKERKKYDVGIETILTEIRESRLLAEIDREVKLVSHFWSKGI